MGKKKNVYKTARGGYRNLEKNPERVDKHLDAIGIHATNVAKNAGIAAAAMYMGDTSGATKYGARSVKHALRLHHSAKGLYHLSKTKHTKSAYAADHPETVSTASKTTAVSNADTANANANAI